MRSPKSGFFKSTTPREIFFSVDETFVTATPDAGPPLITETPHDRATMADNKDALRALKIKTGVLTRVKKELAMYHKEVETEGAKLEKMKAEGMDPHDIKQQDQVLGESSMMIGDCTTRMENAFNDLVAAMVRSRKSTRRGVRSRDPFARFRFKTSRPPRTSH
jgi:tubulin-specific chaperone A